MKSLAARVPRRTKRDAVATKAAIEQATVAAQTEAVRAAEADLTHAQAGQYRKSAAQSAVESTTAQLHNTECELLAAQARLEYTQVVADHPIPIRANRLWHSAYQGRGGRLRHPIRS